MENAVLRRQVSRALTLARRTVWRLQWCVVICYLLLCSLRRSCSQSQKLPIIASSPTKLRQTASPSSTCPYSRIATRWVARLSIFPTYSWGSTLSSTARLGDSYRDGIRGGIWFQYSDILRLRKHARPSGQHRRSARKMDAAEHIPVVE